MRAQQGSQGQPAAEVLPAYLVGRDAEGHWLAVETHGLAGGIFRTEAAAAHFAAFETGHRAGAVARAERLLTLRL